MCPVPLSENEWVEIQSQLSDVYTTCNAIRRWPLLLHTNVVEFRDWNQLRFLRVSQACFYDAANALTNVHYAIGQAIAVRKYYLAQSENEGDTNHMLAELRSQFYADYAPHLLYSTSESARVGILALFNLAESKGKYPLLKLVDTLYSELPNHPMTQAVIKFNASNAREATLVYRNKSVHDSPPTVESLFYTPPRTTGFSKVGEWIVGQRTLPRSEPKYTWDGFIDLLKEAMKDTLDLLEVCRQEWEAIYEANKKS